MSLAILQEERRLKELEERKRALEVRLAQEESLHPQPAELLALAYASPAPVESAPDERDPEARRRVELAAMEVVMRYERDEGHEPLDASADNVGYDIESGDRAIEVKGRSGTGAIILTPNEWITAGRLEERYYLYIVTDALTDPKPHIVRDPANHLETVEELGVVRYLISTKVWQAAAEPIPAAP